MERLYRLDYLRGLTAFGIMYYHYTLWTVDQITLDGFLGRFGVYGVSIFYILSGLTLFHVYCDDFVPFRSKLMNYLKRRALRIYPLFWVATILSIAITKQFPDIIDFFLNITGLFGFVRWDKYFSIVAWSIGNELVFYLFFPVFVLVSKYSKFLFFMLGLFLFLIFIYFAFFKLNPGLSLYKQWKNYINPLNQVFLFYCGYLTGLIFKKTTIDNKLLVTVGIFSLLFFNFFPSSGNAINIVTGYSRILFTGASVLICLVFYKLTFKVPELINKPLKLMGEASYSIYLLHPIIWILIGVAWKYLKLNTLDPTGYFRLLISIGATLIFSYFVYFNFERYFITLGRRKAAL